MLKDAIRAISLANLYLMPVWAWLIAGSLNPKSQYARYRLSGYVAAIINVLLVSAIFWIAITLVRRSGSKKLMNVARWAFLVALIMPVHGIIQTQMSDYAIDSPSMLFGTVQKSIISIIVLVAAGLLMARFRDGAVKLFSFFLLIMFPFALWTIGRSIYLMTQFDEKEPAPVIAVNDPPSPRIIWFIFDEMDQRLAFTERPEGLLLPELDRLRQQSLFATNALPPAMLTLISLPALITGNTLSSVRVVSPAKLLVSFSDSSGEVDWGDHPNLFSEARKLGRNTALVGWYHPYPRMIGDSLTRCVYEDVKDPSISTVMLGQLRNVALTAPMIANTFQPKGGMLARALPVQPEGQKGRRDMYLRTFEEAKKIVADKTFGMSLIHWSIPHDPAIYNRKTENFNTTQGASYIDNLALVDRTMGELRREMEAAGVWDNSVILVTSDHPLRKATSKRLLRRLKKTDESLKIKLDTRIPFVLKLAGQKEGVVYDGRFNTVLTRDLFLALMRGEISTPESVLRWLDQNRANTGSIIGED